MPCHRVAPPHASGLCARASKLCSKLRAHRVWGVTACARRLLLHVTVFGGLRACSVSCTQQIVLLHTPIHTHTHTVPYALPRHRGLCVSVTQVQHVSLRLTLTRHHNTTEQQCGRASAWTACPPMAPHAARGPAIFPTTIHLFRPSSRPPLQPVRPPIRRSPVLHFSMTIFHLSQRHHKIFRTFLRS